MTDSQRFVQPKSAKTEDIVDAAVQTVELQLAAKSPISGVWGFDKENGNFFIPVSPGPSARIERFPNFTFEIYHQTCDLEVNRWTSQFPICFIYATNSEGRYHTGGLVMGDKYHSLQAWHDVPSLDEAVEKFLQFHDLGLKLTRIDPPPSFGPILRVSGLVNRPTRFERTTQDSQ